MAVRDLKTAEELWQLFLQNKLVSLLFYHDEVIGRDPILELYSNLAENFNEVAFGQINIDTHPEVMREVPPGPEIRLSSLTVYRDRNAIASSGELDPISAPHRIADTLHQALTEV